MESSKVNFPELQNGVHIWKCGLEQQFPAELFDFYESLLSEKEAERWRRFKFKKDQTQYLITRALIKYLCSNYLGVKPTELVFQSNDYGKPYLVSKKNFFFNLSHTRGMILCIISDCTDVGIDTELKSREVEDLKLAERFFHESESTLLANKVALERQEAFFKLWTAKEAFIKCIGKGLSYSLKNFYFEEDQHSQFQIKFAKQDEFATRKWKLGHFETDSSHHAAFCFEEKSDEIKTSYFEVVPFQHFNPLKGLA